MVQFELEFFRANNRREEIDDEAECNDADKDVFHKDVRVGVRLFRRLS